MSVLSLSVLLVVVYGLFAACVLFVRECCRSYDVIGQKGETFSTEHKNSGKIFLMNSFALWRYYESKQIKKPARVKLLQAWNIKWCTRRDSNARPLASETNALSS